jgi:hypothetical protein
MSLYVTPERFKAMGTGFDLSGVEDHELRALLNRASSVVDSYCNVPGLPDKYDFRGGTITEEEHEWLIFNEPVRPPLKFRRFYFMHRPLRTVTDFKIYVTNRQYVDIENEDLFINNSEQYVEVVALAVTSVGIFGSMVIPNIGLYRPVARMSYTYGYRFKVTDEVIDATDGLTYRAENQWWVTTETITVKRNGATITTGFTTDAAEGTVTFTSPNAATDVISVSYTYSLPEPISQATAIVMGHLLAERGFAAKGLSGIRNVRIAELEISRAGRPRVGAGGATTLPLELMPEIGPLLDSYRFVSVR